MACASGKINRNEKNEAERSQGMETEGKAKKEQHEEHEEIKTHFRLPYAKHLQQPSADPLY
jgi:hypothetical protein